jgi:hypothetical protein
MVYKPALYGSLAWLARKTICLSKAEDSHDELVGSLIDIAFNLRHQVTLSGMNRPASKH